MVAFETSWLGTSTGNGIGKALGPNACVGSKATAVAGSNGGGCEAVTDTGCTGEAESATLDTENVGDSVVGGMPLSTNADKAREQPLIGEHGAITREWSKWPDTEGVRNSAVGEVLLAANADKAREQSVEDGAQEPP
jgi:hypothetical protein